MQRLDCLRVKKLINKWILTKMLEILNVILWTASILGFGVLINLIRKKKKN